MAKVNLHGEGSSSVKFPSYNIHGFQQCCSAAIMHGIGGYSQAIYDMPEKDNAPFIRTLEAMDQTRCTSLEAYRDRRAKLSVYLGFPQHHAFCMILEALYNKAKSGKGGHNMYASPRYATQTWFLADRRRNLGSISCMTFMHWLKDLGPGKVGRIHISPYRPGAHGGECKGAVFSPNLKTIKPILDQALKEMNDHADWVFDHYKINHKEPKVKGDKVAELW